MDRSTAKDRSAAKDRRSTTARFRLGVLPRSGVFFRTWREKWLRLTVTVVLLAAAVPAVLITGWLSERISCRDGLPSEAIWSQDGECVGVSDLPYGFDLAEFEPVLAKIHEQNGKATEGGCPKDATSVTVAVLSTLTSQNTGGRAVHEIEGYAAAQARANGDGCIHPVLLKVAHMGADEQAAVRVAQLLKEDPEIVAVVGLGLSDQRSADAADTLAAPDRPMPMVASLITAEGFDADGSAADNPDYSTCDENATYPNGVGDGYLYRVSHRNAKQVERLSEYLGGAPDFIVTPNNKRDPYTCTALPFVRRLGDRPEVKFDPADPATVQLAAQRICAQAGAVTAFYTARSRDLGRFLRSIDEQYGNGLCRASSITVASTSDAVRLRVPEAEAELEGSRREALDSEVFRDGTLRLVYTPLADADSLRGANSEFGRLEELFEAAGFDLVHLDGGWAINAYDALRAVSEAVRTLSATNEVTRSLVNSALSGLAVDNGRLGAGGQIAFDNSGNRTGVAPVAVQLCPTRPGEQTATVRMDAGARASDGTRCGS